MTTRPARLLGSLLLVAGGLLTAAPARAADAQITYSAGSADTTGIVAHTPPGVAGCIRGCAWLRIPTGLAVPARRQGSLAFQAPEGTTIVSAAMRLRFRTRQPGIATVLQTRIGGRWIDGQRLRSPGGTTTTLSAGRGGTAVAVALRAEAAVGSRAIRNASENSVAVESVLLTVRDTAAPHVGWVGAEPATGDWQRGALCGAFAAHDRGLGVDRVEFAVGAAIGTSGAGPGTRLQPRPLALSGSVCVDSTSLADGTYGTSLTAVDAGPAGNRSEAQLGLARIDNTAPTVTFRPPADSEARLPALELQLGDAASGVDRVAASVDGLPAAVTVGPLGAIVTPPTPLQDGLHRVAWEVADGAGNVAESAATFGVADSTPPTIGEVQPLGITTPFAPLTVTAADAGAGLASDAWRLAVDGVDVTGAADVTLSGAITYLPPRAWGEGEHVARVTVLDRSGNRAVRTWTFSLPAVPPPATPPAPDPTPVGVIGTGESAPTAIEQTTAAVDRATTAAPRVRLVTSSRRTRVGSRIRLSGALEHVTAARVRIEARVGDRWVLVIRTPVGQTGRFSTPVRLPQAGVYSVRARAGATVSRVLLLRAR
jgi:hypothetical protein